MKAQFNIGETLIETFEFDPNDIGILETKELPKHSEITNNGSWVESIIWHMIEAHLNEFTAQPNAFKTEDILTIKINPSSNTDLFEWYWLQPKKLSKALNDFDLESLDYNNCLSMLSKVEKIGYTFDFGLDAVPYNLKKLD